MAFSVGEVAKRCGVRVSTLHFYERKALITSSRNLGNQRRYSKDVIRRVSVIKAAQELGITLAQIKSAFEALPESRTPNARDWARLSKRWHADLNNRISALTKLRDSLDGCIGCGCLSLKKCPLYNKDDYLAKEGPGPVILNQA